MGPEAPVAPGDRPVILHRWTARKLHPIVLVWTALVFLAFIALAVFVLHSPAAAKALVLAAIGFLVPLVPGVVARSEYRLTDEGLERRTVSRKEERTFEDVFRWSQLDRVVPMRHGFKFTKRLDEPRRLQRFWKTHLSDRFSGEVHVESGDRERVMAILSDRVSSPTR